MNKEKFTYRLNAISEELLDFAETFIKNTLNSSTILYRIEANDPTLSNHLNDFETKKLQEINSIKNQLLTKDEVSNFLYDNGKTPLWINVEIYKSEKDKTIINLSCSRRYVREATLNDKVTLFPPFKKGIELPPWRKEGERFNINWKHQVWKRKWYKLMWRFYVKKYQNSILKKRTNL